MPTISQIQIKINDWIAAGSNVLSTELNEILIDILGKLGSTPIVPVNLISIFNIPISTLKMGTVVNGHTCETGEIIVLFGQDDPSENGIYIIGQNEGETVRHADYPSAETAANRIIFSEIPDESGNRVVYTQLDDDDNLINGANTPFSFKLESGSYTQAFAANTMLNKISIRKAAGTEAYIKIGTTEGGEEIQETIKVDEILNLKDLSEYFENAGTVYYTVSGSGAVVNIKFYYEINNYQL